jgi:hypothetical protein
MRKSELSILALAALALALGAAACGDDGGAGAGADGDSDTDGDTDVDYPDWPDGGLPAAGNPNASCAVPDEALAEDVSQPDHVIGDGTPESCTSAAVIDAVAQGGIIAFDCGPSPVTIALEDTARIFNDTGPKIVIDGGSRVTLSGGGAHRILYMNTCDSDLVWTTDHCQDQDSPQLTVQNLTFVDGDATPGTEGDEDDGGGGAIWARGGRLKIVNSRFFRNQCATTGPDVGGGAVRAFDQYQDLPVYVAHSTFGGADTIGNVGSNGGALSSIGVSWTVINSVLSNNLAIGNGGNPAEDGTPGGGSGGAIYNDGNTMTLRLCGVDIEHNEVNAYGAAIFFVSNDHTGSIFIEDSIIRDNVNHSGSTWEILPGISGHEDTPVTVDTDSIIQ